MQRGELIRDTETVSTHNNDMQPSCVTMITLIFHAVWVHSSACFIMPHPFAAVCCLLFVLNSFICRVDKGAINLHTLAAMQLTTWPQVMA